MDGSKMAVKLLFLAVFLLTVLYTTRSDAAPRPWADTSSGIHVFNDQLADWLTDAQVSFAASHYAGTQKVIRSYADRLRAINPNMLVLNYRLGQGLGYRGTSAGCVADGEPVRVIEGNNWVEEFPQNPNSEWFYQWEGQSRVLNCSWGWYLMDIDNQGWRNYWSSEVERQLQANDADGVFMDSISIPNYLGGPTEYSPNLPYNGNEQATLDFEQSWKGKIERWLAWLQTQPAGDNYLVPNVGSWVTSRDPTDYSSADGVMVEGFAISADQSPYALDDWRLQANRILRMTRLGKAVIGQTYVGGEQERLFTLGTYLLLKGNFSYLNIDIGETAEWWPEYDIPIGTPTDSVANTVGELGYDANTGDGETLYSRRFSNGIVLVNPTSPWDGSATTRTVNLGKTYYQAQVSGGGGITEEGQKTGTLSYNPVTSVELGPYSAAILLDSSDGGGPSSPSNPSAPPIAQPGDNVGNPPSGGLKKAVKLLSGKRALKRLLFKGHAKVRILASCDTNYRGYLKVNLRDKKNKLIKKHYKIERFTVHCGSPDSVVLRIKNQPARFKRDNKITKITATFKVDR